MSQQLNELLNPVTTPSGQPITTTASNAVRSAATTVYDTANTVVVDQVGGLVGGVVGGAIGAVAAPVIDVTQKAKQVYDLVTNPTLGGALALLGRGFPPYRNELNQFASYNYIFTLGCLTNLELNFPLSYRTLGPAIKIIKSGGTGGNKIPTIYETDGVREFFIEDVEIKNHCAPNEGTRLSNAVSFNFKVIEPYSMGQFYHNLRTAALVAGHPNYLTAPFLLSIKFIGYDDEGNVKEPFFSQRHFPIRFVETNMEVTNAGSTYDVVAIPYNDIALTDNVNQTTTDIQMKGRTVGEMLQSGAESLTSKLNELQIAQVNAKQKPAADYYIISFPEKNTVGDIGGSVLQSLTATVAAGTNGDFQRLYESITGDKQGGQERDLTSQIREKLEELPGADTLDNALAQQLRQLAESSVNDIGKATINLSGTGWGPPEGAPPFQEANFIENEDNPGTFNRGRVTYDPDTQTFVFRNMTTITDMIEEVILQSQYARDFIRQRPNSQGKLTWFRIHTHVYNSSSLLGGLITGQSPKIYVYRVVPYEVEGSLVSAPDAKSAGLFDILGQQSSAVKAYNYIYTGQNDDIIDFELKFNQTFYTALDASRAQRSLSNVIGGARSPNRPNTQPATTSQTGGQSNQPADAGGNAQQRDAGTPNSGTRRVSGGGPGNDSETSLARYAHDAIIHTANDLIGVDLTIHGDPYFLADAGLGNYLGISNPLNQQITVDGSMNSIDGMVNVILNFRTPLDYDDKDGWVKYPLGGFLPLAIFSGVYIVHMVENRFKDGKFTQTLQLSRTRNHDLSPESLARQAIASLGATTESVGKFFGIGGEENQMSPNGQATREEGSS